MKTVYTLILTSLTFFLFSEKNVAIAFSSNGPQTRALVVGISDYQDEKIPDLQFAHKDAAAFSQWLQSNAGGNVPSDNIITLLNEEATIAQFTRGIDWLLNETTEGDKVVIYFSGHGDMEAKILNQLGFLLLWDSPSYSYLAGALPVDILKQVITTLSIKQKAKVLMVADACRAGKLAGNTIIGSQLTNTNLSKQFANEQKILSCQANEYSIEGMEWGNGRGAFSYHLINGLYGLADSNNDKQVNLLEIEHFVQDRVEEEVAPLVQIPLAVGNKREQVSYGIDATILEQIKAADHSYQAVFAKVEQRGLVQDVLTEADSSILNTYFAFTQAIQDKRFLEPLNDCADYYFEILMAEAQIENMHDYMLRNYAAALQDDAQQAVNAFLNMETNHLSQSRIEFYESYKNYPKYLNRAAELLGESHYFYSITKAKEYLFEGVVKYFKIKASDGQQLEESNKAIALFQKSLDYEPMLPIANYFIGLVLIRQLKDIERGQVYMERANELAETWLLPLTNMSHRLIKDHQKFEESKRLLEKAEAIDSTNAEVWKVWAEWYFLKKMFPESLEAFEKAKIYNPNDRYIYEMIGKMHYIQKQYGKAELALLKSIELDSVQYEGYYMLGAVYYSIKQFDRAEKFLFKAIDFDPKNEKAPRLLAFFYNGFKRYDEAIFQLEELIKHTDPHNSTWFELAELSALIKDESKVLQYLEVAIEKGFNDKLKITENAAFDSLKNLPDFQRLLKKYFE